MAPPAGTSSMLRSRRRDATLKPNRTLDRSASRGMLYENEELRLRTININAEVEKGQNYIKKLRRENDQLKREIWNLREEYERLENYVKSREQSENEEGDGNEGVSGDEEVAVEEGADEVIDSAVTTLETVVEEQEDRPAEEQGGNDQSFQDFVISDVHSDSNDCNVLTNVAASERDGDVIVVDPVPQEGRVAVVTADALAADVGCGGGGDRSDSGCPEQRQRQDQDLLVVDSCDEQDPSQRGQPDTAAVLQPHTACFEIGNNRQLQGLTVDEVIDAVQDAELREKLRTVCVTDDRCYMTFSSAEYLEKALHMAAFRVRDVTVLLMDTGAGAVILSLTGVPDTVADKDVLKCLKKYGTIIGGVERKTARSGTTGGERYVRVRPTLGAPRYLWFGSDKVIVRQLTEHETGTMNSIARRKSFRSQIKLNLKMAEPARSVESKENMCGSNSGNSGGGTTKTTAAVSVQNGFRFPPDAKTATGSSAAVTAEPKTAATSSIKSTGSPKRPAKVAANDRDGCAVTSGPAESPIRGRRRLSLMGFRRETIKHRGGSLSRADTDSDTSTICRRKLSITGREGTEKVPWCGCWGNGCL